MCVIDEKHSTCPSSVSLVLIIRVSPRCKLPSRKPKHLDGLLRFQKEIYDDANIRVVGYVMLKQTRN